MDEIVDIDQLLSESFCLPSDEASDEINNILQQWKQRDNNEVLVDNKAKYVDTRTFTRPKKRMSYENDLQSSKLCSSIESDKPNVNLRIGGLVTSMQESFLGDVSPPSSAWSFDLSNDRMDNSLITSNDFSNVNYFMENISDLQMPDAIKSVDYNQYSHRLSGNGIDGHSGHSVHSGHSNHNNHYNNFSEKSARSSVSNSDYDKLLSKYSNLHINHSNSEAILMHQNDGNSMKNVTSSNSPKLSDTFSKDSKVLNETFVQMEQLANGTFDKRNSMERESSNNQSTIRFDSMHPKDSVQLMNVTHPLESARSLNTTRNRQLNASRPLDRTSRIDSTQPLSTIISQPTHPLNETFCDIDSNKRNYSSEKLSNQTFTQNENSVGVIADLEQFDDKHGPYSGAQSTPCHTPITRINRSCSINKLSPIEMFDDDYSKGIVENVDRDELEKAMLLFEQNDQDFDNLINNIVNNDYKYDNKMRNSIEHIKKKHSFLYNNNLEKSPKEDLMKSSSGSGTIDSNKLSDSIEKSPMTSSSGSERLLRRSRLFDDIVPLSTSTHKDLNGTINMNVSSGSKSFIVLPEQVNPLNDEDENKLAERDCVRNSPAQSVTRMVRQSASPKSDDNCEQFNSINPVNEDSTVPSATVQTELKPSNGISRNEYSLSENNIDNKYLENAQQDGNHMTQVREDDLMPPQSIPLSTTTGSKRMITTTTLKAPQTQLNKFGIDQCKGYVPTKIKSASNIPRNPPIRKGLELVNDRLKYQYSMKTNSADSLDTNYSEPTSHPSMSSVSNMNTAKSISKSTHNLVGANSLKMIPSTSLKSVNRDKTQDIKFTEPVTVQHRAIKRSGLIRPSSGYYSNFKKSDLETDSIKSASSNGSNTLSKCNSNSNLLKQTTKTKSNINLSVQKRDCGGGSNEQIPIVKDRMDSMKTDTSSASSRPSMIQVPSTTAKPTLSKRSCLPRPMSMANR